MKLVYTAENNFLIAQLRDLLQDNAISCLVKNEFLQGGMGELPVTECWPELWILDDFQFAKASELVQTMLGGDTGSSWHCCCGETIESQFGQCWNCARERPLTGDA